MLHCGFDTATNGLQCSFSVSQIRYKSGILMSYHSGIEHSRMDMQTKIFKNTEANL